MSDDLNLIASAYLDGQADADERARVDADPGLAAEVAAEVERLRQVRAVLGDVDPPPISLREQHLATALAAWERIPDAERTGRTIDATPDGVDGATAAAAASIRAPRSSASRSASTGGRFSNRWMLGAAAVLTLAVGGAVIVRGFAGGDDDDSSSAGQSEIASLSTDAFAQPDAAAALADDAAAETERDLAGSSQTGAADSAPAPIPDQAIDDGTIDIDPATPPGDGDLVDLQTPAELAAYASDALDAPTLPPDAVVITDAPAATDAAAPQPDARRCGSVDKVVGPALYKGARVVVGIDEARRLAIASDPLDCTEVARAPLPR